MGATNFLDITSAKTADAAYRKLCDEAIAYSGHQEGYNGTISTTMDFVELKSSVMKGLGRKARLTILEAIAHGETPGKNELGTKGHEAFRYLASSGLRPAEKWGRCFALRINHNTFAFAGIAAE